MMGKDPPNAPIAGRRRLNAFSRASAAPKVQNRRLPPADLQGSLSGFPEVNSTPGGSPVSVLAGTTKKEE